MKNNHFKTALWLLLLILVLFTSCKDDELDQSLLSGLWVQESVTEDGREVALSAKEQSLKLLVESNGVYRTHAIDGTNPEENYGTWFVTDDKWIDFTTDIWHVKTRPTADRPTGDWSMNHIAARFTILTLNDTKMEIRIKTYVGEKKYSPMFVAGERPALTLSNIDEIETEYKTIKTYIFTFRKSTL